MQAFRTGVLGILPGIVGLIQTVETIKLILGTGESLVGRLLHFEALKLKFREFNLRRDPQCPVCGHIAVRNGACYRCLNCGESLGCS